MHYKPVEIAEGWWAYKLASLNLVLEPTCSTDSAVCKDKFFTNQTFLLEAGFNAAVTYNVIRVPKGENLWHG